MEKIDYKRYLASRKWRLKRKEVIELNNNICERCASRPIENVHHLSYENIGDEDPSSELMGVCRPCHEYLAAVRDDDPALEDIQKWIEKYGLRLAKIWPGKITGSWPWQPLESFNYEREYDPMHLVVDLVAESEYTDFMPGQPRMQWGPGVLAVFYWL